MLRLPRLRALGEVKCVMPFASRSSWARTRPLARECGGARANHRRRAFLNPGFV
jgi:hypothetical protein